MKVHSKFDVDVTELYCNTCSTRYKAINEMNYTGSKDEHGFYIYECGFCHGVVRELNLYPIVIKKQK